MTLIALLTWVATAGAGLYLLSIWLIEYDKEFHAAAATRLPPPVLASHVILAAGGLAVWVGYLLVDQERLAWVSVAALAGAATLGLTMAIRWIGVYRAGRRSAVALATAPVSPRSPFEPIRLPVPREEGPPERNFPLSVVVFHGAFAVATLTLVLLTALGVGGS